MRWSELPYLTTACVKADQQKHNAFNSETGIMNHQVAEYNAINIMFINMKDKYDLNDWKYSSNCWIKYKYINIIQLCKLLNNKFIHENNVVMTYLPLSDWVTDCSSESVLDLLNLMSSTSDWSCLILFWSCSYSVVFSRIWDSICCWVFDISPNAAWKQ